MVLWPIMGVTSIDNFVVSDHVLVWPKKLQLKMCIDVALPRVSFTRVVLRSSSVQNELTSRLGYFNFPCWHFRRFNNCLNVILSFFVVEFFSGFNHSMTYYAAFFQIYCRCTCFRQLHYCEIRYNIKTSKFSSFVTLFRVIMKNSHEILIFMWIKYLLTNVFAIFIALTKKYGDILWKSVFFDLITETNHTVLYVVAFFIKRAI